MSQAFINDNIADDAADTLRKAQEREKFLSDSDQRLAAYAANAKRRAAIDKALAELRSNR